MNWFKKKETVKEYDCGSVYGHGIYEGVNINTIDCQYIVVSSGNGCVSKQCSDFPHECKDCENNQIDVTKSINRDSYYTIPCESRFKKRKRKYDRCN